VSTGEDSTTSVQPKLCIEGEHQSSQTDSSGSGIQKLELVTHNRYCRRGREDNGILEYELYGLIEYLRYRYQ
jgi:hypothetical protein